ncbi:MAG: outer membrane beta-barrel protein [Bacteroidota bacterium]
MKRSLLFSIFLLCAVPLHAQSVLSAIGGLSVTPRTGFQGFETDGVALSPAFSYGATVGYGLNERISLALALDSGASGDDRMTHADVSVRLMGRGITSNIRPYAGLGGSLLNLKYDNESTTGIGGKFEFGVSLFVNPSMAIDIGMQFSSVEIERNTAFSYSIRDSQNLRSARLTTGVTFYMN